MKRKICSVVLSTLITLVIMTGCAGVPSDSGNTPEVAADASSSEASAHEDQSDKEISLKGTLEYGWAQDYISDDELAEVVTLLEGTEIDDLDGNEMFQSVYGDTSMEVSVWDLVSGKNGEDYNGYGTIIVTGAGKNKRAYAEIRHGNYPGVSADYEDNTLWIVGDAISENGVYAELPYYFSISEDGAEMTYALDPVQLQEKVLEKMALSVDANAGAISLIYDGESLYDISYSEDVEEVCIGDHISYSFNNSGDLIAKVTPGVKLSGQDEISYDNMPTIVGTVNLKLDAEGGYNDFDLTGVRALSYNKVSYDNPTALDDAIASAILKANATMYSQGETSAEGHILMDSEEEGPVTKCYVLATYGNYEFQNGNFVKSSGSGVIPTVISFTTNDSGEYAVISYEEPTDGNGFVDDIKKMFPEELWSRCITIEDDDQNELSKMERSYAEEYVGSIGREDAEIGDYSDFEYEIDSDRGLSDEVSNKLMDAANSNNFINNCPYWFGNREVIEEGIRYIYTKEYDTNSSKIIFSKAEYDSGEVVEKAEYSSKTGELLE